MSRTKHHPDYELQLMQRVLRDLAKLTPAGRERVVAYWQHRIASMPDAPPAPHGEQQLDLEADALRLQNGGGVGAPLQRLAADTHAQQLVVLPSTGSFVHCWAWVSAARR